MATSFPSSLDSFTNPLSSDTLSSPSHAGQHTDLNDAVAALQVKVGADSSAVTTSLDYRIAQLESDVAGFTSGKILQVVSASHSTEATSSSTSYADTGLTVTITPTAATSTILVLVSQNGLYKNTGNANNAIDLRLMRDATTVAYFANDAGWTDTNMRNNVGSASLNYLDSPATTSAITYKTQFANQVAAAEVRVQANNVTSTITVMEVSA